MNEIQDIIKLIKVVKDMVHGENARDEEVAYRCKHCGHITVPDAVVDDYISQQRSREKGG